MGSMSRMRQEGREWLRALAEFRGHFVLQTPAGRFQQHRWRDFAAFMEKTVWRLVRASDECWHFPLANLKPAPTADQILEAVGRKERILVDRACSSEAVKFWSGRRGSVVIVVDAERFDAELVFPHCEDPSVISNLGAAYQKSAMGFVERVVQEKPDHLVFGLGRGSVDSGFGFITVFAAPRLLESTLDLAARHCHFTPRYLRGMNSPLTAEDRAYLDKLRQGPPKKKHRYTGRIPPSKLLLELPNWRYALDEEGEEGQDETTIKPDEIQEHIGEYTCYTAADAEVPGGKKVPALLGGYGFLDRGLEHIETLDVYRGRKPWRIELCGGESWQPDPNAEQTRQPGDKRNFPMTVESRLPLPAGGPRLRFTLHPDGQLERRPED